MAKIDNNMFLDGVRGNIAKQVVYRKQGNKTVVSRMPRRNENLAPTEGQRQQRFNFADASGYAQAMLADAEMKALYTAKKEPGQTVRGLMVGDFLKPPVVHEIITKDYKGVAGDPIGIRAYDDFRVVAVAVSIYSAGGDLIEEGQAILNPRNHSTWLYLTTVANADLAGTIIRVTASDFPGNPGVLEITI
ncbi:hypothetical protein MKQ68_12510 [Chitinophaga horti]|uniref:Capsid protein n=1 Tax=Chitinophaga horti TaxID=2920382 RepID=A0ABY6J8F6_9BACT|nr:hypothetical protein [Chitinophaga horti]UYQ95923.1 hypothetical protein MKQ68_12510 [Chitinophaga horti]